MKLYIRYLSVLLKSQMQHKASFFMSLIGQGLTSLTTLIGIVFMFSRFDQVKGFTFSEVLLCFSSVLMAFSLAECFARGFDTFSKMLANGEFDRIMVRPRALMFQVLAQKADFARLVRAIEATIVFGYAIAKCSVSWTLSKALVLAEMVLCGAAVFSGVFVIYAALCFFTTEGLEFLNIFTDGGREFGRYPLGVYGDTVLRIFTFVVPLALVQYYPLCYILDKGAPDIAPFMPMISLWFLLPCYALWRVGLKHYRSTGS